MVGGSFLYVRELPYQVPAAVAAAITANEVMLPTEKRASPCTARRTGTDTEKARAPQPTPEKIGFLAMLHRWPMIPL